MTQSSSNKPSLKDLMPNNPSSKDVALIVGGKPLGIMPALLEASLETKQAGQASGNQKQLLENKSHKKMIEVFRMVDVEQSEFEIHDKAKKDIVVEDKVMGKTIGADGKEVDVVKRTTVKSRNINHLARALGREEIAEVIQLLLVNINNYFNIKLPLTYYQILEISEQIIEKHGKELFIDELVYIFKKAKTDTTLYNNLDGSIIFHWIAKHLEHRDIKRDIGHLDNKAESFDLPNLPKGMLKGAVEKMNDGYRKNIINMTDIPKIDGKKKKKKD